MKNTRCFIVLAAISINGMTDTVSAQYGYQLGVEGAPQLSWLVNKDDESSKFFNPQTTMNGSIGIMYEYEFTKNIGLGVDAIYSVQGQNYQFSGIEFSRRVSYCKIPVMFCFNPEIGPGMRLIGKIGPQLGILSSAELIDNNGVAIIKDQTKAYQNNDYGGVVMGGFGFGITNQLYTDLLLRYDYSFSNAEDVNKNVNINNPNPPFVSSIRTEPQVRAETHNKTIGICIVLRYCYK
jgi:hypothetical protein